MGDNHTWYQLNNGVQVGNLGAAPPEDESWVQLTPTPTPTPHNYWPNTQDPPAPVAQPYIYNTYAEVYNLQHAAPVPAPAPTPASAPAPVPVYYDRYGQWYDYQTDQWYNTQASPSHDNQAVQPPIAAPQANTDIPVEVVYPQQQTQQALEQTYMQEMTQEEVEMNIILSEHYEALKQAQYTEVVDYGEGDPTGRRYHA